MVFVHPPRPGRGRRGQHPVDHHRRNKCGVVHPGGHEGHDPPGDRPGRGDVHRVLRPTDRMVEQVKLRHPGARSPAATAPPGPATGRRSGRSGRIRPAPASRERRSDLDHRQEWPEGKTTSSNLFPALPRSPPPQDVHLDWTYHDYDPVTGFTWTSRSATPLHRARPEHRPEHPATSRLTPAPPATTAPAGAAPCPHHAGSQERRPRAPTRTRGPPAFFPRTREVIRIVATVARSDDVPAVSRDPCREP